MEMDCAGAGSAAVHSSAVCTTAPAAARSQARPAPARQQTASSTELNPMARCRCRFIVYTPPDLGTASPAGDAVKQLVRAGPSRFHDGSQGAMRRVRGTAAGSGNARSCSSGPVPRPSRARGCVVRWFLLRLCAARAYVTVCSGSALPSAAGAPSPVAVPLMGTALRVSPRMMSIDDRGCKSCKSVSRPKKFFELAG